MKPVEIKIITKCPPHGRCKMYTSVIWLLIHYYKNIIVSVIPAIFSDNEAGAPCILINGKPIEPSNAIHVSGEDLIKALKEAGAEAYEGVNPGIAEFDEIMEKCVS